MNTRNIALTLGAIGASAALVLPLAGPAAALDFGITYHGINTSWADSVNRLTVTGGGTGDYGQLLRPNGNIVTLATGNSQTFPTISEDASISIRSCDAVAGGSDTCGSWAHGTS